MPAPVSATFPDSTAIEGGGPDGPSGTTQLCCHHSLSECGPPPSACQSSLYVIAVTTEATRINGGPCCPSMT